MNKNQKEEIVPPCPYGINKYEYDAFGLNKLIKDYHKDDNKDDNKDDKDKEEENFDEYMENKTLVDAGGYDVDLDELVPFFYKPTSKSTLADLKLSSDVSTAIRSFIAMYRVKEKLEKEKLPVFNRLLLVGPPGNGKTSIASAIAKELQLKFYCLDTANIRRKNIGATGNAIGNVMDSLPHIFENGGVLFMDECDSVASKRIYGTGADKDDSASLNILLQRMDKLPSNIIFIAATNARYELDTAFIRRFKMKIILNNPTMEQSKAYITEYMQKHEIKLTQKECDSVMKLTCASWSAVEDFCQMVHIYRIIGEKVQPLNCWIGEEKKSEPIGFHNSIRTKSQ